MPQVGDICRIPYRPGTVLITEITYADEKHIKANCLYNAGWSEGTGGYIYDTIQITFYADNDFIEHRYEKIGHVDISELSKL